MSVIFRNIEKRLSWSALVPLLFSCGLGPTYITSPDEEKPEYNQVDHSPSPVHIFHAEYQDSEQVLEKKAAATKPTAKKITAKKKPENSAKFTEESAKQEPEEIKPEIPEVLELLPLEDKAVTLGNTLGIIQEFVSSGLKESDSILFSCEISKISPSEQDLSACETIAGLDFDKSDGRINWTPVEDSTGIYNLKISAATKNLSQQISFQIQVKSDKILTPVASYLNGVNNLSGLSQSAGVKVSPDGKFVYNLGNLDNSIAVFERNPLSGELVQREVLLNGTQNITSLLGPIDQLISGDGKFLYVAAFSASSLLVFSRDLQNGKLSLIKTYRDDLEGVDGLRSVRRMVFSKDEDYIYATARGDDSVSVFQRNKDTGLLTFVQKANWPLRSMGGPKGLYVSGDGKNVYVTGTDVAGLFVFSRDPQNQGRLTPVQALTNGTDGVQGLDWAYDVIVSRDNKTVYVSGCRDNALTVWTRDVENNGTLSMKEIHKANISGVNGLRCPYGIQESGDEKHLFIASLGDGSVNVFNRDKETGLVTFQGSFFERENFSGRTGAVAVTESPDGLHLYLSDYFGNRLVGFRKN